MLDAFGRLDQHFVQHFMYGHAQNVQNICETAVNVHFTIVIITKHLELSFCFKRLF